MRGCHACRFVRSRSVTVSLLAALAALLAGCPTGADPDTSSDDGGATDEGGPTPETGALPGVDSSVARRSSLPPRRAVA